MIIIQGVEAKLKEAKVGDMVTVEKLKSIDEKNVSNRLSPRRVILLCNRRPGVHKAHLRWMQSGFVAFGHFLTGFFKWMDPELGTMMQYSMQFPTCAI